MPFNPESAKIAGSLSKRGPAKVLPPTTKEKLNILYEDLLEDLIINQKDLSNSEKIIEVSQKGVLETIEGADHSFKKPISALVLMEAVQGLL